LKISSIRSTYAVMSLNPSRPHRILAQPLKTVPTPELAGVVARKVLPPEHAPLIGGVGGGVKNLILIHFLIKCYKEVIFKIYIII